MPSVSVIVIWVPLTVIEAMPTGLPGSPPESTIACASSQKLLSTSPGERLAPVRHPCP